MIFSVRRSPIYFQNYFSQLASSSQANIGNSPTTIKWLSYSLF